MKRINNVLQRFQSKVTAILILSMLIVLLVSTLLIYQYTQKTQIDGLRNRLMLLAQVASISIDTGLLLKVPLNINGIYSPEYRALVAKLNEIKNLDPQIRYIYTMMKTEKDGVWQFVVDADTIPENVTQAHIDRSEDLEEQLSFPGDEYDASRFEEMMKAFDRPAADTEPVVDEWGALLSGYAPIRSGDGRAVAMIGIDIAANDVILIKTFFEKHIWTVVGLGVLLSVILGMLISKRITAPVNILHEGTRRISQGDLLYRVKVGGKDEMAELAQSFNTMSRNLYKSRRRTMGYLFNSVKTLIRVLEAKDSYTKGHSESVASYAAKIALRMGMKKEDVKLFKKICILHDIGKVGIEDSILKKPGKLTPAEYEIIKKHPEIGEGILKPILGDEEMLQVVRGHHERFDGKGYPDKLHGNELNIYAAIVSVADTFHAMTSDRTYRKALSRQEAIAELKKYKGTQFHPKVVEIFLEILDEESKRKS